MAYGTDKTTLENFDRIIPEHVFKELTSITTEEFRLLRDGGEYTDGATGERKHFDGKLFDEVVFNDSVKEFLKKREELADYFDENRTEDIFNYIPAQKTSLVFTPKRVVKQMADLLESENPGCYDEAEATFIDPYMKSGMFIAEIVKRLFRSGKIKRKFPDASERLRHIFEKQVYGCAPSEIIHKIVLRYLLGFDREAKIDATHIVCFDTLPAAKAGTMKKELESLFNENNGIGEVNKPDSGKTTQRRLSMAVKKSDVGSPSATPAKWWKSGKVGVPSPVPAGYNAYLVMKAEWYDAIECGKKRVEYRDVIPKFISMFREKKPVAVRLAYGYTKRQMTWEVTKVRVVDGTFNIHLGKRLA